MSYNLLEQYKIQLGLTICALPVRTEVEKYQPYPTGMLKELAEAIMALQAGQCIIVNYEALTSSNISTIHAECRKQGYKFHCLRSGNKRVLYAEIAK